MCTVSMIGDFYTDKYRKQYPPNQVFTTPPSISRAEFDALKKDVREMKELLKRAKRYDEENGEPDCEMDDKVVLLKKVAELVGVDLSEVFG